MMATHHLSPESLKRKNVNAARRIKNGSPKIREVLRQRCRQRIHERRDQLLATRRFGLSDCTPEVQDVLTGIVHEEFENMVTTDYENSADFESSSPNNAFHNPSSPVELLQGEAEMFDIEEGTEEQWILEEYQKMIWEQKQLSSIMQDEVICPICLTRSLSEIGNSVVCDCGLRLPVQRGLHGLRQNIQEQISAHSEVKGSLITNKMSAAAATGAAALAKKSVKTRFCNKKNDLVKLREELRERCKTRIREQRQELLNQRRFGVSTDDDVQEKLKEIFKAELNDLASTENYDVPEETASIIEKLIDNAGQTEPVSEEAKLIVEEYQKLKKEEEALLKKEN